MQYVIVGGGIAAAEACKEIRVFDPEGKITVISGEEQPFYYRSMIPSLITARREIADLLPVSPPEKIELIHGWAQRLLTGEKKLVLADDRVVPYDKLLLATGSSPIIPEFARVDGAKIFYLRTMDDALKMRKAALAASKAVVLGGGVIGVKTALALVACGVSVTIVELEKHLLYPRLDEEAAALVAARLSRSGVEVITGHTVVEAMAGAVKLDTGESLPADLLAVGIGVQPNYRWLEDVLGSSNGVRVSTKMETELPDVYAAGDIARITDGVSGKDFPSALWPDAVRMGKVAGANMAGAKRKFGSGLEVMNAMEIAQIPIITAGDVLAQGPGTETIRLSGNESYRKFVIRDDRLIGALFVGDIEQAGVHIALLKSAAPLGALKEQIRLGILNYGHFERHHYHHQ